MPNLNATYHAALDHLYDSHTPDDLIAVANAEAPRGTSVVLALTQDCLIVHYTTPDAVKPIQTDWIYLTLIKELLTHRKTNTLTIHTDIDDWSYWNGHFLLQGDTNPLLEQIEKQHLAIQKQAADEKVRQLQEQLTDAQCARAQLDEV